jgi:hypothetical protein
MGRTQKVLWIAVVVWVMLWTGFSALAAEDNCTCFCGYDKRGAKQEGEMTQTACQEKCESVGAAMIICATGLSQYPSQDPWCFTSEICASVDGSFDTTYQPPQCMPGNYFCYPNAAQNTYDLQVSIGGMVNVADLGTYISTLYTWFLSSMIVIAIVMVMFYGGMYIFAGGSSAMSQKAIKGIWRVAEGLVLLFCAVALLELVNPYLVKLQMPQIPMMRPVILGSDASCEDLKAKKYTINEADQDLVKQAEAYGAGKCGALAPVTAGPGGMTVLDGTTCRFMTCDEDGHQCATNLEGNSLCVSCVDVEPDNEFGLEPSLETCSQLDTEDEITMSSPYGGGEPILVTECYYTHEPDLIINPGTAGVMIGAGVLALGMPTNPQGLLAYGLAAEQALDVFVGTCAYVEMDCTGMTSCRDYDDVLADNNREGACLDDIYPLFPMNGNLIFEDICMDDPCYLAPPGQSCWVNKAESWIGVDYYSDCVNSGYFSGGLLGGDLLDKNGDDIDLSEGLLPESCFLQ